MGQEISADSLDHKASHTLTHHQAVTAKCTKDGNIEYWDCGVCHKIYRDAAATTQLANLEATVIEKVAHSYISHEAHAASCTADGNEAYYTCQTCDTIFDSSKTIINEIPTTAKLAHTKVYHAAVSATCTEEGNIEYWNCSVCHKNYNDAAMTTECNNTVIPVKGHTQVHHQAVSATCTEAGSIEYWSCSVCNKDYSNAAMTVICNDIVVPANGHTRVHHEAVAATCTEDGNIEYWSCSVCHKDYNDAAMTTVCTDTVVAKKGHTKEHHAAVAASCTGTGNIEYWSCSVCHKNYSNEAMTTVCDNITVAANGHSYVAHPYVAATCTEGGHGAYYTCANCSLLFADQNGTVINESDITYTEALGHKIVAVAAQEATCGAAGNEAYWRCTNGCGKIYHDAAGSHELDQIPVIAQLVHTVTHHEAHAATCTEDGNIEYWSCPNCHNNYRDNAGTQLLTTSPVIPAGHTKVHQPAVSATCTEDGNIEYWNCSVCHKNYINEAMTTICNDTIVAAGHKYISHAADAGSCTENGNEAYYTCENCELIFNSDKDVITEIPVIVAVGTHNLTHNEAVTADCETGIAGVLEHWHCENCGNNYTTEAADEKIVGSVIIPATHNIVLVPMQPATCETDGYEAHYACSKCHQVYSDAAGTATATVTPIAATGHELEFVAANTTGDCLHPICEAHYACKNCEQLFADAEGNVPVDFDDIATTVDHKLTRHAQVYATCSTDGNYEYYTCDVCEKIFVYAKSDMTGNEGYFEFDFIPVMHGKHKVVLFEAYDATCTEPGLARGYYYCACCGGYFEDYAATTAIDPQDMLWIEATGHNLVLVPGYAANCQTWGRADYYKCDNPGCDHCSMDAADTIAYDWNLVQLSQDHKNHVGRIIYYPANVANCQHGAHEYDTWHCDACNYYYRDENLTMPCGYGTSQDQTEHHRTITERKFTDCKGNEYPIHTCATCNGEWIYCTYERIEYDHNGDPITQMVTEYIPISTDNVHVPGRTGYVVDCHGNTVETYSCLICNKTYALDNSIEGYFYAYHNHFLTEVVTEDFELCNGLVYSKYYHCSVCGYNLLNGINHTSDPTYIDVTLYILNNNHLFPFDDNDCQRYYDCQGNIVNSYYCNACQKHYNDTNATIEWCEDNNDHLHHCSLVENGTPISTCSGSTFDTYYVCEDCQMVFISYAPEGYGNAETRLVPYGANGHMLVRNGNYGAPCKFREMDYYICGSCMAMYADPYGQHLLWDLTSSAYALEYFQIMNEMQGAMDALTAEREQLQADFVSDKITEEQFNAAMADLMQRVEEFQMASAANMARIDVLMTLIDYERYELTGVPPTAPHDLTHHAAVPATCCNEGMLEYYYCENCHSYFYDAAALEKVPSGPNTSFYDLLKTERDPNNHDAWEYNAEYEDVPGYYDEANQVYVQGYRRITGYYKYCRCDQENTRTSYTPDGSLENPFIVSSYEEFVIILTECTADEIHVYNRGFMLETTIVIPENKIVYIHDNGTVGAHMAENGAAVFTIGDNSTLYICGGRYELADKRMVEVVISEEPREVEMQEVDFNYELAILGTDAQLIITYGEFIGWDPQDYIDSEHCDVHESYFGQYPSYYVYNSKY